MNTSTLVSITTLLIFAQQVAYAQAPPVNRTFEVKSETIIPAEGDDSFLAYPWHLSTDSEGNIYIADYAALDIKVYDSQGEYIKTIGRVGRGPGEFNRLTAMHIDKNDQLIVVDGFLSRITMFDRNHDVKKTRLFKSTEMNWPSKIIDFNDSVLFGYLLHIPRELLKEESNEVFNRERREKMFHVMDAQLDSLGIEFGSLRKLGYPEENWEDEFFRTHSSIRIGSLQQYDNESVVFAHYLYNGELYHMDIHGNVQRFPGYTKNEEPFSRVRKNGEMDEVINTESIGLFNTDSGFIHFTLQRNDDGKEIWVEHFNNELELQSFGRLDGLPKQELNAQYQNFRIDHYSNGRFFSIDYSSEGCDVTAFELDGI